MSHTQCPNCATPLRGKPGVRKLICPSCQHKFRLPEPPPVTVPRPRVSIRWRIELFSAVIGLASLAALAALQVYVLLPAGRAHPGQREIILQSPDEDTPDSVQVRPYNDVLFWGSVIGYAGVAAAEWFAIRRWKAALIRDGRRHGIHGLGSRQSGWRFWGGGTAALIVLAGGLALALRYKAVLWDV
jgi:hypothetical protein